jgi:tRNA G26 N,N-dimethylase Trm1
LKEVAMELNEQEAALLKVLAEEWDASGPPGFLETTVIAQALRIRLPDARSIIHSLFVKGLVGTDEVDLYAAYLLPEGYEIARKK